MTTITTQRPPATGASIAAIIQDAVAWVGGQALLSQGRCVDVLLDLSRASHDEFLEWLIAERLRDIRFLHAVDGDEMRADLAVVAALVLERLPAVPSLERDVVGEHHPAGL